MKLLGLLIISLTAGMYFGNSGGDQKTLQDCATKGVALLVGGASIECSVVKEKP